MKEVESKGNIQPKVPDIFIKAFPSGFRIPSQQTEIDKIAGQINREFVIRKLKRRTWIEMMCG